MSNAIISITELTPATSRKFKDPRLTEATKRIAAIYTDAAKFVDTKNREIASILAEVMEAKSYEKDGFKIGRASVGKECRSRWSPYH